MSGVIGTMFGLNLLIAISVTSTIGMRRVVITRYTRRETTNVYILKKANKVVGELLFNRTVALTCFSLMFDLGPELFSEPTEVSSDCVNTLAEPCLDVDINNRANPKAGLKNHRERLIYLFQVKAA